MESPSATNGEGEANSEVPGIRSRSGRVIKRSAKMRDFAYPEKIKTVTVKKKILTLKKPKMNQTPHIKVEPGLEIIHFLPSDDNSGESLSLKIRDENQTPDQDHADVDYPQSDVEIEYEFVEPTETNQRIVKQRKDKGRTRYSAYMLWAKETRHSILLSNPELSFASVSKRLSEMWTKVPTNKKYNWKRRAQRLKNKALKSKGEAEYSPKSSKNVQKKFLSKTSSTTPLTKQQKQLQKLLKAERVKAVSIKKAQKQHKEKCTTIPAASGSYEVVIIDYTSFDAQSENDNRNLPVL